MANMTVTTAAAHIGEVWIPEVIRAQEFSLEIAPRVWRKWEFKGFGDVYHIPRIPNIAVATKVADTPWTPTAYTDTEQTVTINIHEVAGFEIEDITALLSNTDLKAEMQKSIGYSLGRAVDVRIANIAQNFSLTTQNAPGSDITWDDLVYAWQLLGTKGVNLADNCTWFFSTEACASLLKQDFIVNALYGGNEKSDRAITRATIGTLLRAPVVQTNLLRSASAGQHDNFLIQDRGVALIMAQKVKMVSEYIAKDLAWVVGGHQIYGLAEVNRYDETPGNVTATDNMQVLIYGP